MWSSAAVAHLLQGSMYCAFREALLRTSVVTSGNLSYCCLSICSNQSGHSPLIALKTCLMVWLFVFLALSVEYDVIITNRNYGQNSENKTQVVIN